MKSCLIIILFIFLISCDSSNQKDLDAILANSYVCLDNSCQSNFEISKEVSPDYYIDENGFNHIQFWGPKYFTVKG